MPEREPEQVVEEFVPTSGKVTGVIGLLIAAGVVVVGLVDREQGFPPVVIGIALLAGALIWATMLRPRMWATGEHLVMRNALSTTRIPLAAIEQIAVRQVVSVRAGERRYVSPAVGKSWRQSLLASRGRARTTAQGSTPYPVFVEERLHQLADDARRDAGVAPLSDEQLALAAGVRREWAWPEIAALAAGALVVVVAVVV